MNEQFFIAVVTVADQWFEGPYVGEEGRSTAHRTAARYNVNPGSYTAVVVAVPR